MRRPLDHALLCVDTWICILFFEARPIEGVLPSLTVTRWKIRRTRKVLKPLEPESASAEGLHVLRHKVVPDPADLYNRRLILILHKY